MSTRKEVTNDDDDVSSSDVGGSPGGSPGGKADNSQLQAPAHDSSARRDDSGLVSGWQDHSPGDEPETALAEIRHIVERQAYQGPLPHPQDFAGFEEVLPGAADRILSMAEKRQQAEIDQRIMTSRAEARAFVGAAWAVSFFLPMGSHPADSGAAGRWTDHTRDSSRDRSSPHCGPADHRSGTPQAQRGVTRVRAFA